jgi:DNA-binding NarL/FixJ family response regulator
MPKARSTGVASEATIRTAIVDDHPVISEGLYRILSAESDIELSGTASNVVEALALVERHRPHVVLMDYVLPDGDGVEATRKNLKRWPETKILMMSGSDVPEVHVLAFSAGCVGFLAKNRPWGEVVAAVRAASRGQSVLRVDELTDLLTQLRHTTNHRGRWLTAREIDVLRLLAAGRTTSSIAGELFLSAHTVRNHISSILSKLGAHSKLEAVAVAARDGLISFENVRHEGDIATTGTMSTSTREVLNDGVRSLNSR